MNEYRGDVGEGGGRTERARLEAALNREMEALKLQNATLMGAQESSKRQQDLHLEATHQVR